MRALALLLLLTGGCATGIVEETDEDHCDPGDPPADQKAVCDDGDPCTFDRCLDAACVHSKAGNCP